MDSIVYKGIFTSYGFLAIIFFALGLFLFTQTRRTLYSHTDFKVYICGAVSFVVSIYYLVLYIGQIKHLFG